MRHIQIEVGEGGIMLVPENMVNIATGVPISATPSLRSIPMVV